jgi:hypothetical protein
MSKESTKLSWTVTNSSNESDDFGHSLDCDDDDALCDDPFSTKFSLQFSLRFVLSMRKYPKIDFYFQDQNRSMHLAVGHMDSLNELSKTAV